MNIKKTLPRIMGSIAIAAAFIGLLLFFIGRSPLHPPVSRSQRAQVLAREKLYPCSPFRFGWVRVNRRQFGVDVAETPQQRERGLMFRERLAKNEGMLFVFDEPTKLHFWMKNTLLPLDLAYLDADGRILGIYSMKPLDERPVASPGMAQYVLEVGRGQLKKAKAKPGDRITWGFF